MNRKCSVLCLGLWLAGAACTAPVGVGDREVDHVHPCQGVVVDSVWTQCAVPIDSEGQK